MEIPNNNNNLLESNNTLLYFIKEVWVQIFKHSRVHVQESLCLVCKLFHVIIRTQLSEHKVIYVCSYERYARTQKKKELVSKRFRDYHEPLLKGIKVHDEITFLTKNEFLDFCKNPQSLIPMRTILKLDGFNMDEIRELLKMAHNSFHITILSLGKGTQISSNIFPEICKETLPYLKGLNFSLFKIFPTLWDFSGLPLRKFNMHQMRCYPGFRIRMPYSLKGLYINCHLQGMINHEILLNLDFENLSKQERIKIEKHRSNVGILLNDCHTLDEW
jgi:hypothetical protein